MLTSLRLMSGACSVSVLLLSQPGSSTAQQANHLARVQRLGLESLPGKVPAYYSPGARARAAALQKMLDEALVYFRDRLGVEPALALAVLDESHWTAVRPVPYGVPWVSYAPYVAVLPSHLERSVIVRGFASARERVSAATRQALTEAAVAFDEVPYRLNDFIAYHEVGHVVIEAYGLTQSQRWFDEMLATFAAYAFMRDRHPDQARAWDALMRFNIDTGRPEFRTLDEFERRYADLPQETYGWFQGMFHLRLADIYRTHGVAFLPELRAAGITAGIRYDTPADLLARLERIANGFQRWADTVAGVPQRRQ